MKLLPGHFLSCLYTQGTDPFLQKYIMDLPTPFQYIKIIYTPHIILSEFSELISVLKFLWVSSLLLDISNISSELYFTQELRQPTTALSFIVRLQKSATRPKCQNVKISAWGPWGQVMLLALSTTKCYKSSLILTWKLFWSEPKLSLQQVCAQFSDWTMQPTLLIVHLHLQHHHSSRPQNRGWWDAYSGDDDGGPKH